MKVQEAYLRFLTKVNRNLSSNNIVASKDRFVLLYNEEQIRYLDYSLDFRNDADLSNAEEFLVVDSNVLPLSAIDNIVPLDLNDDWFEVSSAYAYVDTSECKNIRLSLFEIKNFDQEQLAIDANNAPSIRYRESPYYIGNNNLNVYTKDFTIKRGIVTYYRFPKPIDISGYIDIDGTASTDIDPEGTDWWVNKIISMCAESFFRNYGDANLVTINKDRIINNN
tara:strand:+ start:1319 stop:1987 length:669 start_codon:yes stop_codon:yes gene_type:complete